MVFCPLLHITLCSKVRSSSSFRVLLTNRTAATLHKVIKSNLKFFSSLIFTIADVTGYSYNYQSVRAENNANVGAPWFIY